MKKGFKVSAIVLLAIICVVIISLFTTHFYLKMFSPQSAFGNERIVDDIDLPFVDDPEVIGKWQSIDFVKMIDDFEVGKKKWSDELYLKDIQFLKAGKTQQGWWTWTKGVVMHQGDKTASKYSLKEISGSKYMFFEWKSGDYVYRHRQPYFYVLKKVE